MDLILNHSLVLFKRKNEIKKRFLINHVNTHTHTHRDRDIFINLASKHDHIMILQVTRILKIQDMKK